MLRTLLLLTALSVPGVTAGDFGEGAVFAVVTHKAGLAKGLAHNHFITAGAWEGGWADDAATPLEARLSVTFQVADLVVDDYALASAWYPRLAAWGLLTEPFEEVSASDRAKIGESMRGKKQLKADAFPTISAELVGVQETGAAVGDTTYPHTLQVKVTIKGTSVLAAFPGKVVRTEAGLALEAVGALQFSRFGIKPYSAMLGAVANEDLFHVVVAIGEMPR